MQICLFESMFNNVTCWNSVSFARHSIYHYLFFAEVCFALFYECFMAWLRACYALAYEMFSADNTDFGCFFLPFLNSGQSKHP